jgi:hypothetical protein
MDFWMESMSLSAAGAVQSSKSDKVRSSNMSLDTKPIVIFIINYKILPSIDAPIYSRAEQLMDCDETLQAVAE